MNTYPYKLLPKFIKRFLLLFVVFSKKMQPLSIRVSFNWRMHRNLQRLRRNSSVRWWKWRSSRTGLSWNFDHIFAHITTSKPSIAKYYIQRKQANFYHIPLKFISSTYCFFLRILHLDFIPRTYHLPKKCITCRLWFRLMRILCQRCLDNRRIL